MNFDQIVIREFLKLNPVFTDTPDLLAQKRVGNFFTAAVNFPRTEEAAVTGGKVVKANVPDLANLFRNITPDIEIYKPTTNRDVAKVLFEKYGIVADINDITPTAIVYDPLPLEVEIVANGKTITGKVKVKLTQKVMDLTEIITVTENEAVIDLHPTAGVEKFLALKYFYGIDFTEHRMWLYERSPITITYDHSRHLAEILNSPKYLSPVEWTFDTFSSSDHPYNSYIDSILYNGPTTGLSIANAAYTHVLHLKLRYAHGLEFPELLLHYDWRP